MKEKRKVVTVQFNDRNDNKMETFPGVTTFNSNDRCISFIQRTEYGLNSILIENEAIRSFLVEEE